MATEKGGNGRVLNKELLITNFVPPQRASSPDANSAQPTLLLDARAIYKPLREVESDSSSSSVETPAYPLDI
jgi:hypothetical protein